MGCPDDSMAAGTTDGCTGTTVAYMVKVEMDFLIDNDERIWPNWLVDANSGPSSTDANNAAAVLLSGIATSRPDRRRRVRLVNRPTVSGKPQRQSSLDNKTHDDYSATLSVA
jgi:hypothetical protein